MMNRPGLVSPALRELARRKPAELDTDRDEARALAVVLRERFAQHPKQRAFWQSAARRAAALCTRRAGKSDGGVREWLATAITVPGWRGTYCNETSKEARKVVWSNDMGQGWLDLLSEHGKPARGGYLIGGVVAKTNSTLLEINFDNGSQISLFCADDAESINRMRGQAKDDVWVDEAQKFRHLRSFVLQVASACLKDKRGRLKLTGSPSEDAAGYFYDVTPEEDSGDAPLIGWEVHRWSVVDNPWFGTTEKERWDRTAGEALAENGWDGTEGEFLREWMGKWVKGEARYVYPVHVVPQHQLIYAPQRLTTNPVNPKHPQWLDFNAAFADLPRAPRGHRTYTWLYAIGVDFGYAQDPFAIVVWAFTHHGSRPDIFELFSWKEFKVLPDDQKAYLKLLWEVLDNVVVMVGDPAGQAAANMAGWRERIMLPIDDAEKSAKATWQALMAGDIRKGRVRYRASRAPDVEKPDGTIAPGKLLPSPLLDEHQHLVPLPTKPGKPPKDDAGRRASDGKVHGNHASDAGLYSFRHLTHYLNKAAEDKPPPGSPEHYRREEEREQRAVEDADKQLAMRMADEGEATTSYWNETYGNDWG